MKVQTFLFLLTITIGEISSQVGDVNQAFTSVLHFGNNISVTNFDGTNSKIYVSGNSATLVNPDGSQSTIDFFGRSSATLFAIDGTTSTISHNGLSSTVFNSDGTQINVFHMQRSSTCSTGIGKHSILHTFGRVKEMRYKDEIDVLIHANWYISSKALKLTAGLSEIEIQN